MMLTGHVSQLEVGVSLMTAEKSSLRSNWSGIAICSI
jgi:hypothetical protein